LSSDRHFLPFYWGIFAVDHMIENHTQQQPKLSAELKAATTERVCLRASIHHRSQGSIFQWLM
jgi:hypothetical protein